MIQNKVEAHYIQEKKWTYLLNRQYLHAVCSILTLPYQAFRFIK